LSFGEVYDVIHLEFSAIVGIDPNCVTTRELTVMVAARQRHLRGETAEIVAALFNVNRDPKKRKKPFHGFELNPFISSIDRQAIRDGMEQDHIATRNALSNMKRSHIAKGGKITTVSASSMKVIRKEKK
jgi:hypothetical protein